VSAGPEVSRIVDQLERVMCADAWYGEPVVSMLQRISFSTANAKPARGAHSIREIVRHMTAWTNEVRRRLNGVPASTPQEGDWPKASGRGEAAWAGEIDALIGAHNALILDLGALTDDRLSTPIRDPRNRKTREGVTRYVLLHGLAQHHAYHAGQIAILSKQ
ncbi:MAG TPA: DinB family protein, partial [Vicinamibacterales bacterium]